MSNRQGGTVAQQSEASVRRSITVEVDRAQAFAVFTEGFDSWWIRSHHLGEAELDVAVMEPGVGGRWYERDVDGSECEWGRVLEWDPPGRLVLAWQINGDWKFDRDLVTEVEVTFTAVGPSTTRVDLEHRNLDRFGDSSDAMRAAFESDGGWSGLLQSFVEQANAA